MFGLPLGTDRDHVLLALPESCLDALRLCFMVSACLLMLAALVLLRRPMRAATTVVTKAPGDRAPRHPTAEAACGG